MNKYSIIEDPDFIGKAKRYRVWNNETNYWIIDGETGSAVMALETASRCLVRVSTVEIMQAYLKEQKIVVNQFVTYK